MKKILSVLVICMAVLLVMSLPEVSASESDSVSVKVSITPTLSVNITETTYNFGAIETGKTIVSITGVAVTNDGSGINETYSLSLTNPSGWTAGTPGKDIYRLCAQFDSDGLDMVWSTTDDVLSTTPVVCTDTKFAGDATGVKVPYNTARTLWFRFESPTVTAITSEQTITVTVTAQLS